MDPWKQLLLIGFSIKFPSPSSPLFMEIDNMEMDINNNKNEFCFNEETQLTVFKSSLFYSNDGFTVYDVNGQILLRVDPYGPDSQDKAELILRDATGVCLLTVHKKLPSFHHRWEGFLGEKTEGQKPIFTAARSSIMGRCHVSVEVYKTPTEVYQIEGSFSQRSCTFYNTSKSYYREVVAEIKRKVDASTNMALGKDVFCLWLKPGVDAVFVMGLVLVLDQVNGESHDGSENEVERCASMGWMSV